MNAKEFAETLLMTFEECLDDGRVDFEDEECCIIADSSGAMNEKYMTDDDGFWIKLSNGDEFCVTVQKR